MYELSIFGGRLFIFTEVSYVKRPSVGFRMLKASRPGLLLLGILLTLSGCGSGRVTMDVPNARCAGEACETPTSTPVGEDVSVAICGNGILEDGEACDDGVNDGRYETCAPGCRFAPGCGDNVVDPEE